MREPANPGGFFSTPPRRPAALPRPAPAPTVVGRVPTSTAASAAVADAGPWSRFWARTVDMIVCVLLSVLVMTLLPAVESLPDLVVGCAMLFAWVFIEAALVTLLGTTPGKFVFNISLQARRTRSLDLSASLMRGLGVWWYGMGAGLPVWNVITLVRSYNQLIGSGETQWDADGGFEVRRGPFKPVNLVVVIVAALALAAVAVFLQIE